MNILLSPALIALLPTLLGLIERVLDAVGLLGGKYIRLRLQKEPRAPVKEAFVEAANAKAMLEAIEGYFRFEETASTVIKFHLAFLLSVYFAAVEKSGDLLVVRGWPVLGLAVLGASLATFLILLIREKATPVHRQPFVWWGRWTWALFLVIAGVEGWEHVRGG